MGFFDDLGGMLGLPNRGQNEFRGVNQGNFQLPGFQDRQQQLQQMGQSVYGRQAPQAADSGFRADQAALVQSLRNQMNGQNSMSAEQLRQNAMTNLAQQQALAASGRPGNAAMLARTAAQNAGRLGYGLSGQQAMAGIAERNAAANALGGALGQFRGQDLGLNQFNAGMQQQQMGMNDQAWQNLMQQQLQNAMAQQGGMMGYEQARGQRFGGLLGVPSQGEQLFGGLMGGAQLAGMG